MGNVYMINQQLTNLWTFNREFLLGPEETEIAFVTLTAVKKKSIFFIMKQIYQLLDNWKSSHPDASLLLSVDLDTAKIVHSYFHDMSDGEYQHFSMKDGEMRKYIL